MPGAHFPLVTTKNVSLDTAECVQVWGRDHPWLRTSVLESNLKIAVNLVRNRDGVSPRVLDEKGVRSWSWEGTKSGAGPAQLGTGSSKA